ncbi:MAG TPA: hypothetical protein VGB37_05215 [Candidatus Lokiarchaeia archaeon]
MKKYDEFCDWLLEQGFRECSAKKDSSSMEHRFFIGKDLEGPDCECNERQAPFHLFVYHNWENYSSVEFVTVGEQAKLVSGQRLKFMGFLWKKQKIGSRFLEILCQNSGKHFVKV